MLGFLLFWLLVVVIVVPVCFGIAAALRETKTAEQLAPATGYFVDTDSDKIFVQEAGPPSGPAVILAHGTAAWSELWRASIAVLAERGFHVFAIDLPPFGFSTRDPASDYSRASQARRIDSLFQSLNLSDAYIIAHSIGAAPVVETAMRYPNRIRGLVLVAGALGISDSTAEKGSSPLLALLDVGILRDALVASTVTNPLLTRTLFRRLVVRKEAIDGGVVTVLQRPMKLKGTTPGFGRWLKGLLAPDPNALSIRAENYAKIDKPTALIWGDGDEITPLEQANRAQALFRGSTLDVMHDVGHVPQLEDPATFHPLLIKALTSMEQSRAATRR